MVDAGEIGLAGGGDGHAALELCPAAVDVEQDEAERVVAAGGKRLERDLERAGLFVGQCRAGINPVDQPAVWSF